MSVMHMPSSTRSNSRLPQSGRRAQRGVTILFALLTLVALLLATLALVRSIDTGTVLMGNIGFKQDATVTADQATRQAITWLSANGGVLNTDNSSNGYYSSTLEFASDGTTSQGQVDATGQQLVGTSTRQVLDWDSNSCSAYSGYATCLHSIAPVSASTSGSNTAQYLIFRLCSVTGDYTATGYLGTCAKPLVNSAGTADKRGDLSYADSQRFAGNASPYYRIVVRVQGARNTTSFTETIVHF